MLLVTLALTAAAAGKNMNADIAYTIANPVQPGATFGFRGKFFELESPVIKSKYSEVYWDNLDEVPLPPAVVAEFDGKIMAITGFEVNILRNTSKGVENVPCYESYNHHYGMSIGGKGVTATAMAFDPEAPVRNSHGGPAWVHTPNGLDSGAGYSVQSMNEHNGNEARQTYHGMPPGYVVPIESPTHWRMTPMQINTRNPDGSGERCDGNCPLPRRQNAWKGAPWSGILECPCTTRAVKTFEYELRISGDTGCTYNSSVTSADECFAGAAEAAKAAKAAAPTKNATADNAAMPAGCFVDGGVAVFNTAVQVANVTCGGLKTGGCVCRGMNGWIDHGDGPRRFSPGCMGEPKSELLATHNPTCDINQYDGGLQCCGNNFFLLDRDQEVPPLIDEVYFKTRWYYEEFVPAKMAVTYHLEWQFGHIEYSVPKAPAGTPVDQAVHKLETHFTVRDFLVMGNQNAGGFGWDLSDPSKEVEFVFLGFHCHSPACLGGQLWNADTGDLICEVAPQLGNSTAAHLEEDYLWLPPCQFGNPADGYVKSPQLSWDTNLTSVKTTNSSVAHSGVMAIWQGRGAWAQN